MQDPSAFRKFVEVGRGETDHWFEIARLTESTVVLLKAGPHAGKTATIVEVIDHNRVSRNITASFQTIIH